MLVKTTTQLKATREVERKGSLSAARQKRLNELKSTLRERTLAESLARPGLRDFLDGDPDLLAELEAQGHTDAGLTTQSVLFSLPSPTQGDVAPTHEAPEPEASPTDRASPSNQPSPLQAKQDGGAPPDDPKEGEALSGVDSDDEFVVSGRDQVEPTPLQQQLPSGSRAYVDHFEALFPLQRRAGTGVVRPPMLPRLSSGGRELPEAVRKKMETAFGVDFRAVRILIGPEAEAVGALAFTAGEQIFFKPGQYDPLSRSGQELLGHELAHVVQQRAGRVRPDTGSFINTDTGLEREADRAGAAAASGAAAHVVGSGRGGAASGAAIQREKDPKKAPPKVLETSTADGNVKGTLGEDKDKNLTGTITLKNATLKGGIKLENVSGTGVADGTSIKEFKGSATVIIPVDGEDTFKVVATDVVISPGAKLESGTGTLTTLREIVVAKGAVYTLALAKGATAKGTLGYQTVKEIDGNIQAILSDGEGPLLTVDFKGTIDPKKAKFNGTATVALARRFVIEEGFGPKGDWLAVLDKDTSLTATFKENTLTELGTSVTVKMEDAEGSLVDLNLQGKLIFGKKETKPRFEMTSGTATTKRDFFVYALPEYGWEIFAKAESTITLGFEDGKPKEFTGTIPLSIRDAAGEAFTLTLDGKSTLKGVVDGTAKADLVREATIPLSKEEVGASLTVKTGTTATMTFVAGSATKLTGQCKATFNDTVKEQPLGVDIDGEFDLDLKKQLLVSATGTAALAAPINFPEDHLRLDSASGSASVVNGKLSKISGDLGLTVHDEGGDLIGVTIKGDWEAEGNKVTATGTGKLLRNLEYVVSESTDTRIALLKDTEATVVYENGKLKSLEGTLKANVSVGGVPRAGLEVTGKYDVAKGVIEKGTGKATLLEPISLLDGKVVITGAELTADLAEGKLTKVAGDVQLTAPALKVDKATAKFSWRNEGGEDLYAASGTIDWTFFDEGDRKLTGSLEVDYKEDKTFTAKAAAKYQLNKHISGGGTLKVDEKIEPEIIEGWLKYEQTLVQPRDLFRLKLKLFELVIPVGIPGVNVEFGMSMGTGLALQALKVGTEVKLKEAWKLKADDTAARVPAFETTIKPTWGADFDANIAAWLGIALGAPIAKVSLGAKGKVILKVGLTTSPTLTIGGGGDKGFHGKLAVGAKVVPTLSVQIVPYAKASLGSFYDAEKEFPGYEHELASFAGLDWSMEYGFGDAGPTAVKSGTAPETPATGTQESTKTSKTFDYPAGTPADGNGTDEPALKGADIAKDQEGKAKNAKGENEGKGRSKLDLIIAITKGLGALEQLISLIGGAVKAFLIAGPFGFAAYLAWKAFKGELSWQKLVDQVNAVQEALSAVRELLADKLHPNLSAVLGILSGEVTIKDALFGDKGKMISEVERGAHRDVMPEVRSDMINVLVRGFCTGAAEDKALQVVEYSFANNDLKTVMLTVDGGPDALMGAFDGANCDRAKEIFTSAGIPFRTGLSRVFGVGENSGAKLAEQQGTDLESLKGTPPKRRAGIIERLVEGDGKSAKIVEVIAASRTMGDLPIVVELVKGGVGVIRDNTPPNRMRELNRQLFGGGVHAITGLDFDQILPQGLDKVMLDPARVRVVRKLMGFWRINGDEENIMVAMLKFGGNSGSILSAAGTSSGRVYDRMSGSNADTVAALFGGKKNLEYEVAKPVQKKEAAGSSAGAGAKSPNPGNNSGPVQTKADDNLSDSLQSPAQRKGAPAPRTATVQRLAEHFDAVQDEDS